MRRLGHWTLNALTVLSLVMCVGMVGLWVRSYYRSDNVYRISRSGWFEGNVEADSPRLGHRGFGVRSGLGCMMFSKGGAWWEGKGTERLYGGYTSQPNVSVGWHRLSEGLGTFSPDFEPRWQNGFGFGITRDHSAWDLDAVKLQSGEAVRGLDTGWRVSDYHRLSVPYWFFVLLFAVAPFRRGASFWRGTKRVHGLCPRCGYDLRATPDRCPECGTAAEGSAA